MCKTSLTAYSLGLLFDLEVQLVKPLEVLRSSLFSDPSTVSELELVSFFLLCCSNLEYSVDANSDMLETLLNPPVPIVLPKLKSAKEM